MSHSFLPPSGASVWSKCAMWPTMNQRYPQDESPEAAEGTAAHWVATEMLVNRIHPKGSPTPNGLIVTDEMIENAELVNETVATRMPGLKLHVEEQIAASRIHPECYGTPDIWAVTGHSRVIEIIDDKFGHRFVDEHFNAQGLCYLSGIIDAAFGVDDDLKDVRVNFTVIQPRCYYKGSPVRTHSFLVPEAAPYLRALASTALLALAPQPVATTNDGCIYCPGRHSCDALQKAAYSDAEFATDRMPLEMSPTAMGLELTMLMRALDRLGARVSGLQEITLANIKAGKQVPYFHVENGDGRKTWNLPDSDIVAMGELFGVNLSKPGVVTPAQAKKLGVDDAVISGYSYSPATAAKLVQDNPADVRRTFKP
jgi:hypothetical protein